MPRTTARRHKDAHMSCVPAHTTRQGTKKHTRTHKLPGYSFCSLLVSFHCSVVLFGAVRCFTQAHGHHPNCLTLTHTHTHATTVLSCTVEDEVNKGEKREKNKQAIEATKLVGYMCLFAHNRFLSECVCVRVYACVAVRMRF